MRPGFEMNVMVTGAAGFIGSALCRRLSAGNKLIGVDCNAEFGDPKHFITKQVDLTDTCGVERIFNRYPQDVVIHCAGIAHQKIGAVDSPTYMRVNSEATESLAKSASRANPDVSFIFLSSVSVYGEGPQTVSRKGAPVPSPGATGQAKAQRGEEYPQIKRTKPRNDVGFDEDSECKPSSDYASSKLDAESRLNALFDTGIIHSLTILRLAPVYDRDWSFNLDRRIFAPGKLAYLRFGSGMQRMSALARPNLVDFIEFLIHTPEECAPLSQVNSTGQGFRRFSQNKKDVSCKGAKTLRGEEYPQVSVDENNLSNRCNLRMNVCDAEPYDFNRIIEVFRNSGIRPRRPVISVPLSTVWLATRVAGCFLRNKKAWVHSCYDKLASDLVFDNGRMMGTGFRARHSLETILSADYAD